MSDPILIAIVTALAVVLAAIVAGMVTLAIALVRWHADNRRLWLWNRQLVDHIYRGLPPPPPPPPAELFD
ncbi:hypothetical protein [Microbacterium kyungheense]|uniref:Uncharacterized protein n=1 Tax=Microbacterium kyungheense TaxID=1263636 RepID=A0A543EU67_9MICO|nr:hypothetical protein [Microbacterium kyungheense]TQM25121.1 hypothetical protein FB391_2580 [Microbacterium kyungheense]